MMELNDIDLTHLDDSQGWASWLLVDMIAEDRMYKDDQRLGYLSVRYVRGRLVSRNS